MGRNYLLFIFLFGAFASLMSNGVSAPGGTFEERGGPVIVDTDRSSDSADDQSATGDAVRLERSSDGHFYADVEINGRRIHAMVDTGASLIALSREDARAAGLATSISMPQVIGEGASGEVHGEVVTLDRVALGPKEAHGLTAVVLDSGSQSLLGQSFLGKFDAVEIRGDTMILQ